MISEILGLYEVRRWSISALPLTPPPPQMSPPGMANLDPRDMIDRIYVGDH